MSDIENIIAIKIMDRIYKIKCRPEEAIELEEAARHVDNQMRKARQNSNINSTDRVAVITALNVCHEFILLKKQKNNYIANMENRIQTLQNKIQNYLASEEEVAV